MKHDIIALLKHMVQAGASDLHLAPGTPPRYRIHGRLQPTHSESLNFKDVEEIMKMLVSSDGQHEIQGPKGCTDFSKSLPEVPGGRFRGNVAKTQQGLMIALRFLPDYIPEIAKLGLPKEVIIGLLQQETGGIILVTGPTGSGKTTTLASMIDWLNRHEDHHIVTVEAPVEVLHQHQRCLINQRELPLDAPDFASAIRDSLRQDPDIILVGEMRDLETITAATTAAETGHLVLATLHTNSAKDTINRIIDAFLTDQQPQIRAQLASSLLAVISQRLIPRADGSGRVAAFEIMVRNSAISHLIRENKIEQITTAIQTGRKSGMNSFDEHLAALVRKKIVAEDVALSYAQDPKDFKTLLNQSS